MGTYVPNRSPVVGIINGRDAQDVKNANDVDVADTTGVVVWSAQPEDNVIGTSRKQIERHRARFIGRTTNGAKVGYQMEFEVVNLRETA